MIAPWLVTSELYSAGETMPQPGTGSPGKANWVRKTYAKKPPIRAITMPVNMYCIAIILWSVEKMYFSQKLISWW